MIKWQYFPKSDVITKISSDIVDIFIKEDDFINSDRFTLKSNEVLSQVTESLEKLGFTVEKGKKKEEKIFVPVLFGINGRLEKYFEADAYNKDVGYVIEVEAGRAILNNQFLKDLFQASIMHNVHYLAIAVRNKYRNSSDFNKVISFFDALYASNRISLPLKGILIIGY